MAKTPRQIAEGMAAELGISRHALTDAKIDSGMTWLQINRQLAKQLNMAEDWARGRKVNKNDLLDDDIEDLPDIFSYYHKD